MRKDGIIVHILVLSAITVATFWGSIGHDFVTTWDDDKYVITNEIIRNFSLQNIRSAFSTSFLGNYAPIQIISYMADHAIAGLDPAVYHLHNLILHVLNGVFCYILFLKLTGKKEVAWIGTFIFLVHPVQVETVAWVSQRKNLLSMFFFLPAFFFYIRYADTTRKRYYFLSLLCFFCSLLAKSAAVILPTILILFDVVQNRKKIRESLPGKIPFLLLAGAFSLIALRTQLPELGGGRAGYHGGSPVATMMTMIPVFFQYLLNIVLPTRLSADYLVPVKTTPDAQVVLCALLLVSLAAATAWAGRKKKELLLFAGLAILGILPVSQIIPIVTLMNDRYLYFPMVGAAPILAIATANVYSRSVTGRCAAMVIALWLLSLPVLSHHQNGVWKNGITLWHSVLERSPQNNIAMTCLGDSYREKGNDEEALKWYLKGLSINPDYFMGLNNASLLLLKNGRELEANRHIDRLIKGFPNYARGYQMRGTAREVAGDLEGAESAYAEALRLDPTLVDASISMAAIMLKRGNMLKAEFLLTKAREIGGDSPELSYSTACLEAQQGNTARAMTTLEKVVRTGAVDVSTVLADPCFTGIKGRAEFMALTGKDKQRPDVSAPAR